MCGPSTLELLSLVQIQIFIYSFSLAPELNEEKYNGKYFADCALTDPDTRYAYGKQEADQLAETIWKTSEEITNSEFLSL